MKTNFYKKSIIETYLKLQKRKNFNLIRTFKKELEQKVLTSVKNKSSYYNYELVVRQYYLNAFGFYRLDKILLYHLATGKRIFFYPIPPEHISVYKKNGFKVFPLTCYLTLYFLSIGLYFRGISFYVCYVKRALFKSGPSITDKYVYFDKLTENNLPVQKCGYDSFDIITWFIKWKKTNIDIIGHNVKSSLKSYTHLDKKIVKLDDPFPLQKLRKKRFFLKTIIFFLKTFFYTLVGKWYSGFMTKEVLDQLILECLEKKDLAEHYLFYNSLTFYRPLWTYVAAKKGADIISYFYSGGKTIYTPKFTSYSEYISLMNWPVILVWDTYFKDVLEQDINKTTKIEVVGSIDFSFKDIDIPSSNKQILSLFDSPPIDLNQHLGFTTSNELALYKEEYHIKFLSDLIEMGEKHNLDIYIKPKRSNQKYLPKNYLDYLEEISKKPNVVILNGDLSAKKLIKLSTYNVSFPFTSTAIIGKELNKKSLYYSPTTLVSLSDKGCSGVDFVNTKTGLIEWFKQNHLV